MSGFEARETPKQAGGLPTWPPISRNHPSSVVTHIPKPPSLQIYSNTLFFENIFKCRTTFKRCLQVFKLFLALLIEKVKQILLYDQSHESVVSLWEMKTVFFRVHSIVSSAEVVRVLLCFFREKN
jgi:hypothetical protein